MKKYRLDCKSFLGDRPCRFNKLCDGCKDFLPIGRKILIIKLSAPGDVLRTTPILYALKRKYPKSHITWLTDQKALELLVNNSFIDKVLVFDVGSTLRLQVEKFDLLLSLDKEPKAAALAGQVNAKEKRGFGFSPLGNIYPLNKESQYAYLLGLSDELKFRKNQLTYQRQIYDMCKMKYKKDEYILEISKDNTEYAKGLLNKLGVVKNSLVIGLNTGAGRRFANKAWTISGYIELIKKLKKDLSVEILLLGGPGEVERNREIESSAKGLVFNTGCSHSLLQFSGLVNSCRVVVSADTLALHIAIALKKKIVTIIGPTCSQEIELYNRGEKIVSDLDCAPCYKNYCDKKINCMQKISSNEVFAAIKRQI